ncbi:MAG: carbohydrate kinase family protein, partial [Selenomonadaceae bacterium]|nr:carbohydrate kinase family protein [Selenomonadaceae bacterium]
MKKISIIGTGVVDVLAGAVDEKIFNFDSTEMDYVKLSFGGDALNQSIVLSRLGKSVKWISKLGDDDAGQQILNYAKKNGVDISGVKVQSHLATGVTVVLVDAKGERRFLTNPNSSLRKLSEEDILPHIDDMAEIVSFASLFISSMLDVPAMERIFRRIKSSGRTLAL